MSLANPAGMDRSGRRGRKSLVSAGSDSQPDLLTSPLGLIMVGILAFNLIFIALYWRDGGFNWIFEGRGATIDASSKSWMGAANRGHRVIERRGSPLPGDTDRPKPAKPTAEPDETPEE